MSEKNSTASLGKPSAKMTVVDRGNEDGVVWVTCEAPLYGAVNGYVRIPEDHPWHGLDYDDIDVDVHGGLTYSSNGWIGFDCLHCGDIWPGGPDWERNHRDRFSKDWTPEMVAVETRSLARKVAEAGK